MVVSAYLPLIMPSNSSGFSLASLRSLRILRPLRTVSKLKNLKALIITVFNSIPYLVEILVVMVFVFLVFAIAGLQLFRGLLQNRCFEELTGIPHKNDRLCGGKYTCPENFVCGKMGYNPNFEATGFDDIITSIIVVFQIVTLEGWTQVMYFVFSSFTEITFFFFFLIVFLGAFVLIQLTTAVISIKFEESQNAVDKEELDRIRFRKK